MVRCVVGGQMDKQLIEKLIVQHGGDKVSVEVKSDIDAALAIKMGSADYYFGSCATGSGGAIAMALGIVGPAECVSITIPGKVMSDEEIATQVSNGKKVFGFVNNDAEKVVPVLLKNILNK